MLLINTLQSEHLTQCVDQLNIWSLSSSLSTQFSFIDLIKGIIPSNLMQLLKLAFKSQQDTFTAVSHFMHFIFEQSQAIWRERCSELKTFESSRDITDALKRSFIESSGYSFPTYRTSYDSNQLVDSMVRNGSHWSNFWCSRGQALFLF
jgi:hypothetical protein